jgi:hypothetical protein
MFAQNRSIDFRSPRHREVSAKERVLMSKLRSITSTFLTSVEGQQRSSSDVCVLSATTPTAAQKRTSQHFAFVPLVDLRWLSDAGGKPAIRIALLLPQWDRPLNIATVLDRVVVIAFPAAEIV